MKCSQIVDLLEKYSPKGFAQAWDNVSLLVGSSQKEVNTILVTLDVDMTAIDYAIENKVDMIVSHHPVIFSSMKSVTDKNYNGSRIYKLLKNDIAVYSMHTNYDLTHMADLAAEKLGLTECAVFEVSGTEDGKEVGIGKMAQCFDKISLKEWAYKVKKAFNQEYVKVYGDLNKVINTVAVYPGSGKDAVSLAVEKGIDLIITGDIGHHTAIDAIDCGTAIIDATHYGIESIFTENVAQYLQSVVQCNILRQEIRNPVSFI